MHAASPRQAGAQAPLVLSCSPRHGGNCDSAAALYARTLSTGADETGPQVEYLRDFAVHPCIACGLCAAQSRERLYEQAVRQTAPLFWQCPLSKNDDSAYPLKRLTLASSVCIIAPIFFYHLPAQLKALLDRLQPVWLAPALLGTEDAAPFAHRRCRIVLIAGRPKGEQLFTGSLLSLKHALAGLNIELEEALLLRGLDEPDALLTDKKSVFSVEGYALGKNTDPATTAPFKNAAKQPEQL